MSRPDLIPQFADLCLQVKGIEWSVVSGLTGDEVHISVRNVGYVRAAGEVVQAAFGEFGSAGGHRSAAKAVIPSSEWLGRVGSLEASEMRRTIASRFVHALDGSGTSESARRHCGSRVRWISGQAAGSGGYYG